MTEGKGYLKRTRRRPFVRRRERSSSSGAGPDCFGSRRFAKTSDRFKFLHAAAGKIRQEKELRRSEESLFCQMNHLNRAELRWFCGR